MSFPFPFPFFGAGTHHPFEHTSLFVSLGASPKPMQRKAITDTAPAPFANALAFSGTHLFVSPQGYIHPLLSMHYDADPGDEDDLDGRPIFAADSRVRRYHEDVERWLAAVHEVIPIIAAVQPQDLEGGETELSPWHHWSVQQLSPVLARYDKVLSKPKGRAKPAQFLACLLELLIQTQVTLPLRFVRWQEPEVAVRQAILSGQPQWLQEELDALDPDERQEVLEDVLESIGLESSEERLALLSLEAVLIPYGGDAWGAVVASAILEAEEPVTDKRVSRLLGACTEHQPSEGIAYGCGLKPISARLREVGALRFPEDDFMLAVYFSDAVKVGHPILPELAQRALTRAASYFMVISTTGAWYTTKDFARGVAMVDAAEVAGTMKDAALLNAGLLLAASGDAKRTRAYAQRAACGGDSAAVILEPAALVAEGKLDEAMKALTALKTKGFDGLHGWRDDPVFEPLALRADFVALFA